MKVLFIGLGSIGQRHLRNLRQLYGETMEVSAYRVKGLSRTFNDRLDILEGISVEEKYNITPYGSLQEALSIQPDIVFITNITSRHMECAIEAAKAGCHIFLEKPVSDSMKGIDILRAEAEKNRVKIFIGYQYRYHICLLKLKEYLAQGFLGKIISVEAEMGERIDGMHAYEDYKDTYMARKDMGGGVILNQQVHELDYLQWLFGRPESVYAMSGCNSSFCLDVEDYCRALYSISVSGKRIPVSVHADFVQSPPVRRCKVVGDLARIEADLLNHVLYIYRNRERTEIIRFPEFKRNQMFLDELKDFIEGIRLDKEPSISLEEGVVSLKMALGAKLSGMTGRKVELSYDKNSLSV
ncbi:Gfo/Idh/MocA family protein [Hungatella hathewayi]|uniref:Gfo/Idh/MocA family protein n=1 Tax=Hungatella hathewayi TaxID=154046 RepID=UPI0035680E10